ncbi:MAG: sigma-70 family RNA polymerase sigma factor [Gemmataceae bacterium]|nr:sigma-70 family RNA polymerase sigma factor [Gemmataceae bacterium]
MNGDDHRLVTASLAGDTRAFEALVIRYQDRLFNTVFRLVDNAEDARDVVQEAFLSAYQSLGSFKGDSLFFTWLYRIAINSAISMKRKQRAVVRLASGLESGTLAEPADPSESTRPGRALEMAEEERRVHEALARLSAEHRAVLVLKDMEGRKYEEIAELLDVPIGTVRSRLHRARLDLRDILLQAEKDVEQ